MILGFGEPEAELIWTGIRSRRRPYDIQATALRKLRMLNQAVVLNDLRIPPGNRLEALKGNWQGWHSIRINSQWRIYFVWKERGPGDVKIVDYHADLLPNPHPGDILIEDFLKPMGISQNALARAVHVPPRRINEIVLGKRAVSADTDLRLARFFGMSDGFFLGLQADFDMMERRRVIGDELKQIEPYAA